MKKRISLFLFFSLLNIVFSQVGINTETPTETLDVNGKARVRNTEVLKSAKVSALYVDEDGVIGKSNITSGAPQTTFISSDTTIDIRTRFNAGNTIELPITNNNLILNTLNSTIVNGTRIRISSNGTYQISGSINIYMRTGVNNDDVFMAINIQRSTNNGGSWQSVLGLRPVFKMMSSGNFFYNSVLPLGVVNLRQNDLLRFIIYRTNSAGTLQGSRLAHGQLGSRNEHGTKAFTFSVSKF